MPFGMNLRRFIAYLVFGFALVAGPLAVFVKAQSPAITIGCLADLSGPYASAGTAIYEALRAYVKALNDSGGIDGINIELLVADTRGTSQGILAGASKLKAKGAIAFIGPSSPANVLTLRKYAETYSIPLIITAGSSPILTFRGIKTKWTFSSVMNLDAEIKALFKAFKKKGYRTVGLLLESKKHFREAALWIKGYCPEFGLQIGCLSAFYPNRQDLAMKYEYMNDCMPDIVLLWAEPETSKTAISVLPKLHVPVAVSHDLCSSSLFTMKISGSLVYVVLPRVIAKTFVANIKQNSQILFFLSLYPRADFISLSTRDQFSVAASWDALRIVLHAVRTHKAFSRERLRDALEGGAINNFPGLIGTFTFNARNHSGLKASSLVVLKGFRNRWTVFH